MRRAVSSLALAILPCVLAAQGVTTAAIQGTVLSEDSSPIAGARVRVTNTSDGRRWEVLTGSTGGYLLEDVAVGGPYRIEVRALGFTPEAKGGVVLALGQRIVADFTLVPAPVELSPVTIDATADPVLSPARTGPAEIISAARIAALPNPGRAFLPLTALSPQVAISPSSGSAPSGGITIAGQNRLLNGFQIDGGVNQDAYTGRLPGRETLPRPISLEAVEEIQVLAAPADVRFGGFAAGLANAVTKSGTNAVHGSTYGFLAGGFLVGKNADGDPVESFTTWQYGGTVGGPIVRDHAHYFLSVDLQHQIVPDPGPLITDTAGGAELRNIGISYTSAARFQSLLQNYGLDPGNLGPSDGRVPATDVFGKVTAQVGTNSHLELSHHYTDGDRAGFIDRGFRAYRLSSVGRRDPSTVNASRLIWTGLVAGRWSSELIASYIRLRDGCRPNATYPLIRVMADQGTLMAGSPNMCPSSFLQDAFEVTENLSTGLGAHVFTLGMHAEVLTFEDDQMNGRAGFWDFRHLDSLAAGRAFHYDRTLPGPSDTGAVKFRGREVGIYAQDRWNPTRPLTLTVGFRIDVPVLPDAVASNGSLQAALGVDTERPPSGYVQWSPRLGINYDLQGEGRTLLRGGVGLFNGRPPYGWVGAAYRDNGTHELVLSCDGSQVPPFDPLNQPITCAGGAPPLPRLTVFDRDVEFPQSLKVSLGVDHRLPADVVSTVDFLYTRAEHQLYFSDANLPSPVGAAAGEGGRPLYGTIDAAGFAHPARPAPGFDQVIRVSNRSGDRTIALSAQLRKRFGDRAEGSVLYAYTRAWDLMSVPNARAFANLGVTPLDGTLQDRRLRPSYFEVPHRLELNAILRLPYRVRLSVLYAGASGMPYTYVVAGDANADGIGNAIFRNDIVYVPRSRLEMSLDGNGVAPGLGTAAQQDSVYAVLDAFINAEPCLQQQRGRILVRNSCRNPWFGTLSARLTKTFPTLSGQSLELTADVYNLPNLVKRQWGQARVTSPDPFLSMLRLVGYDATAGRGVYRLNLPALRQIRDLASRWQMEISVRYVF